MHPGRSCKRRLRLVDQLNEQTRYLKESAPALALKQSQEKALDVIGSEAIRRAVDLSTADSDLRARYGRNLFGQSVLLGRRLLDAGARLVQVNWLRTQGAKGYAWDSHRENFEALRERSDPPVRPGVRRLDRPTWNRAASSTRRSWSSRPSSAARPR